ncbi:DUF5993 family protein [Legionella worsleiensis]|uniref:DUF5993 family protein n=1 Tax=Legionella worsleiensis TaxID=45076 RepID=UPI0039E7FAE5
MVFNHLKEHALIRKKTQHQLYSKLNEYQATGTIMMILLFLLYFFIGLQILFKPTKTIPIQFMLCLLLTCISFNYHSNLVPL